jgi:ribonuclease-3
MKHSAKAFLELECIIGHTFQSPSLLKQALMHPSVRQGPFQRLEFLGDRVLGLIMAQWLYEQYPKESEGGLTKRLAQLVKKETLLDIAQEIHLSDYVSTDSLFAYTTRIMADVCEALIGAIYLDAGLEAAQNMIHKLWGDKIQQTPHDFVDAKSALQEYLQSHKYPLPLYRLQSQEGPSHAPIFHIELLVQGIAPFYGKGASKKEGEQNAAKCALQFFQTKAPLE